MKILPVGAELFHTEGDTAGRTDRQTDTTKMIVAFHNFAKTPKTCVLTHPLFTTSSSHF